MHEELTLAGVQSAAEREAWKLAEDLKVDVVTIHPSLVVGPLSSTRRGLSADIGRVCYTADLMLTKPTTEINHAGIHRKFKQSKFLQKHQLRNGTVLHAPEHLKCIVLERLQ